MRKPLWLLFIFVLACGLCACTGPTDEPLDQAENPAQEQSAAVDEGSAPDAIPEQSGEAVPADDSPRQKISVGAVGASAVVSLSQLQEGEWVQLYTCSGYVGKNGVSEHKQDGDGCTPAGIYQLGFAFGLSQPDTDLNFKAVTTDTVWVDDSNSAYYNTWQSSTAGYKDWQSWEKIYDTFSSGRSVYAVNIEYNGDGLGSGEAVTPGAGSAIFLCGRGVALEPTSGCIDISSADLALMLQLLDAAQNPVIEISGTAAPAGGAEQDEVRGPYWKDIYEADHDWYKDGNTYTGDVGRVLSFSEDSGGLINLYIDGVFVGSCTFHNHSTGEYIEEEFNTMQYQGADGLYLEYDVLFDAVTLRLPGQEQNIFFFGENFLR